MIVASSSLLIASSLVHFMLAWWFYLIVTCLFYRGNEAVTPFLRGLCKTPHSNHQLADLLCFHDDFYLDTSKDDVNMYCDVS